MVIVAEEEIETAFGGPSGASVGRTATFTATADAPFADESRTVTGLFEDGCSGVAVFQRGVEAVVADNLGMPLV